MTIVSDYSGQWNNLWIQGSMDPNTKKDMACQAKNPNLSFAIKSTIADDQEYHQIRYSLCAFHPALLDQWEIQSNCH